MQTSVTARGLRSAFRATPQAPRRFRSISIKAVAEDVTEVKPAARKAGPLSTGGTKTGVEATGKDAGAKAKAAVSGAAAGGVRMQIVDGYFKDERWANGRWDFTKFPKTADGETDWDNVIDAEIARRSLLEQTPIPSTNEDPVLFNTDEVPMMAWIKRFHLPEAEKLNGRAAMMGYVIAAAIELVGGPGLVDQQESFFGKFALHIVVFAILLVRSMKDVDNFQNLFDEATFYDRQWAATWDGKVRPSETEN
eukprot:gene32161-16695_t